MRQEVLASILERMAIDSDFRQQVETRPGKTLVDAGLTWEEFKELQEQQAASGPQAEALGERSSAAFTAAGSLWNKLTGNCGCTANWIRGTDTGAYVPFCN